MLRTLASSQLSRVTASIQEIRLGHSRTAFVFWLTGSVLRAGKRLSFCTAQVRAIRGSEEELIATMLATIATRRPDQTA